MRTISEPIEPEPGSFDTGAMARGQPGVPRRFTWRGTPYEVVAIERTWRELSAPPAPASDRYVRRHGYVVRTAQGPVMRLVAERRGGRTAPRWWLRAIEDGTS